MWGLTMKKEKDEIQKLVIEKYADIARKDDKGFPSCCCNGSSWPVDIMELGKLVDYTDADLALAPGEANLGLGCGNPISRAGLQEGETVLDLGSGAGFDAFLAAERVGRSGKVIGVDMTPEMVERARTNAKKLKMPNVDFRWAEIENLPVEDGSVDVVISNCVINLSTDKRTVYKEMFRTLKPGGRIIISDVLRSGDIPEEIRTNPAAYTG